MTNSRSKARAIVLALALAACNSTNGNGPTDGGTSPDGVAPHRCDIADCQAGLARTCDAEPLTLECGTFGGSCADFVDDMNTPFSWCSCGPIAEGQGKCLDGRNGVTCDTGLGIPAQCLAGTRCIESPGDPYGLACECDGITDGVCPDPACTNDPDCAHCTPSCGGKQCGDNGCGGQCGTCAFGQTCTSGGQCQTICVPDCTGKTCGNDGCGGSCGSCSGTCTSAGQCQGTCVPSCTGKTCGNDGCGGSCGTCTGGLTCGSNYTCGCDFFATEKYTFTLDPNATWPPSFNFIGLNLQHIDLDGTENPSNSNGAFMGFGTNAQTMYSMTVYGCRAHIRVKRDYAVSGHTCQAVDTVSDRTTFVLKPPIINANGTCTAPPL